MEDNKKQKVRTRSEKITHECVSTSLEEMENFGVSPTEVTGYNRINHQECFLFRPAFPFRHCDGRLRLYIRNRFLSKTASSTTITTQPTNQPTSFFFSIKKKLIQQAIDIVDISYPSTLFRELVEKSPGL